VRFGPNRLRPPHPPSRAAIRARVRRGGRALDVDGEAVVPGDLLLLESGARVSAGVRLAEAHALRVDESLLTGESLPVDEPADLALDPNPPLAERRTMLFAGSVVAAGRGLGVVVATGEQTEVGAIGQSLAAIRPEPPPPWRSTRQRTSADRLSG
jgi:P-type Ca2+ transporter type 2C